MSFFSSEEPVRYNKKGQLCLKKVTKKPEKWIKNIQKAKRNIGKEYISKGKIRRARQLCDPCLSNCKLRCSERITNEQRHKIFHYYWNLGDVTLQRKFIVDCMEIVKPKYRKPKEGSQRSLNFAYKFNLDECKEPIRVCRTMFINTIDVSHMTLRTAYKKFCAEDGTIETDLRGRHLRKNIEKDEN